MTRPFQFLHQRVKSDQLEKLEQEYLRNPPQVIDFRQSILQDGERVRLSSPNWVLDEQFDWSIEKHREYFQHKGFELRRQYCCRPIKNLTRKRERVTLYLEDTEEQIQRVYLRASEFSLLCQQMDVDFILFEFLEKQRVHRKKIEKPKDFRNLDISLDNLFMFEARETFIPYIVQIIFYDKILKRYSVHFYQLQKLEVLGSSDQ